MNAVDIVILVILAFGVIAGFRQGFILQSASILGSIVALTVARAEYTPVRDALMRVAPHSPWLTAIAYLIVFLVVWGAIVAAARIIRRLARLMLLGWADRIGGVLLGLLQSALVLEVLIYFGKRLPNSGLHLLLKQAAFAPFFLDVIPFLSKLFPHVPK
ncbi:MAG: hypothetical protein NVS2B16_09290 [Chloroflexota bacterium]